MNLHSSVEQSLNRQQINYVLASCCSDQSDCEIEEIADGNVVKIAFLQDEAGKVQVLLPADRLLDLGKLNEITGRKLRAISNKEYLNIAAKYGGETIPALPQLTEFHTLADDSLYHRSILFLESGIKGQYIKLSIDQFKRTLAEADQGSFSVPLSDIIQPSGVTTEESIITAVNRFTSRRIKQRLEETLEIPPLPETADQIIKMRVNPDTGIADLVEVIEKDPSLCAQVISWASSPYYGAQGEIESVHDAVMRVLGFDLVINLALGITLGKTLDIPKEGPKGMTPFWEQAVLTAAMMEALVKLVPKKSRPKLGLCYLSGLLNNFGYLLLAHIFPPYFKLISRSVEANRHVPIHLIERYHIGVCNYQINAWLMEFWQMPPEVVAAIHFQKMPSYTEEHAIYSKLLYLSLQLLRQYGVSGGTPHSISNEFYESLSLDKEKVEELASGVIEARDILLQMACTLEGGKN